jgi:hypothetical protein
MTPPLRIPLRTSLPKLSLTPILGDPNIRIRINASIKGNTRGGVGAGHVEVFAAEGADGVDDAPVLFYAGVFHHRVVPFGVGVGWGGEEEGAEGEEEEGKAGGDAGHCCGCVGWVCLRVEDQSCCRRLRKRWFEM